MPVLQSHIFKPFEQYYEPNWGKWTFSQNKVITMLKAKKLHRRPELGRGQQCDLVVPRRRQALVPLHDDDR